MRNEPNGKPKVTRLDYTDDYFKGQELRYGEGIYETRQKNVDLYLSDIEGKLVLDIGCGVGVFSNMALSKGAQVISADFSRDALIYCQNRYKNTVLIQCDAENLPFKNEAFDCLLAMDIVEHLYYPEKFCAELHRVLSKSGYLIMQTANVTNVGNTRFLSIVYDFLKSRTNKAKKLREIKEEENRLQGKSYASFMHIFAYTVATLIKLLKECNFRVIEYNTFPFISVKLWDLWFKLPIISKMSKPYKGDRVIVLCKKV